jgi:alpha-aminoadipate/glutamate carrier protein LysW
MSAPQANCPVCDAVVNLQVDVSEAEVVRCGDCGSDLEVQSLEPPLLAEAPAEEEDWGQ